MASTGVSLGGVVMTPVVQALVTNYGWRDAWVILGVVTWVVIIPTAFVMRRTPEDHGLRPDGDPPEGARPVTTGPRRAAVAEVNWTRPEAVRTVSLWLLIGAWGLGTVGLGAMMLHMVSFLTDSGFTVGTAAFLFSVQAWASLFSKGVWGVLMNRIHARYLAAIGFCGSGLAVLVLIVAAGHRSTPGTALALSMLGLAVGGTIPLQETVWAGYYGRMHLGKIRSVALPFSIIFSALGPKFAANLYDRTGSYHTAFYTFVGFWLLATLLILLARPPRRRAAPIPPRVVPAAVH
jgi:sugar phosphate permease